MWYAEILRVREKVQGIQDESLTETNIQHGTGNRKMIFLMSLTDQNMTTH